MTDKKISQHKTVWISIFSLLQREHQKEYTGLRTTAANDGTVLYTNGLDALHHLGSRINNIVYKGVIVRSILQLSTCVRKQPTPKLTAVN